MATDVSNGDWPADRLDLKTGAGQNAFSIGRPKKGKAVAKAVPARDGQRRLKRMPGGTAKRQREIKNCGSLWNSASLNAEHLNEQQLTVEASLSTESLPWASLSLSN